MGLFDRQDRKLARLRTAVRLWAETTTATGFTRIERVQADNRAGEPITVRVELHVQEGHRG